MHFPTLVFLAFPALAFANPLRRQSQCSSPVLECCATVEEANSADVARLAAILGVVLAPSSGPIGVAQQ
ncbi:hypothetical protein D9619_012488 [Psilocybe cf. subviscida]|uniref:Hydrophobin n=1 Tax=Psilocybe cf. subviscida TaxID=2480587 RepID=A0A8H5ARB8_9AGAR|nr:hypothetical protein D9619_012488 [Psilocybe cf. subviscida]